ncbi:MAG TPA: bifunctional demethylmenaquinone methyltransferase/2-methoxy-6-polyprenyl-1,4-benzoquinol methylase UbiE [Xanthomonadaceae bacterium]|nr:bifunctional demethylmenaquinone methyltransferase/2-methoxy-6-polyprenyl-1,4-benzoquinol methylase UbiE [Xanthomonadaceae bacterium]
MEPPETTHFGYQRVAADEKARKVAGVFDSVAGKYDLMNDLMSLGVHRWWKRFAVSVSGVRAGERVLDLAGGTGDLSSRLLPRVGPKGLVVLSDINATMLAEGRRRLIDEGALGNIAYVQADAEQLPFPDNTFDCVIIGFGLRNVTHKERALAAMYRALKPGGRAIILEFSHPVAPGLKPVYDLYSFTVLPVLGKLVADDAASYRYLAESIRMHPDQETLLRMLEAAGFERCQYFNLTGGIVAVHRGYKF